MTKSLNMRKNRFFAITTLAGLGCAQPSRFL